MNQRLKPNYFELFSLGFAIGSIFSCTVIYAAYLLAGLAILFAILSRGPQMKFSPRAKWSIIIGVCGIVLSTVLFIATFLFLLEQYGSSGLSSIITYLDEYLEMKGTKYKSHYMVIKKWGAKAALEQRSKESISSFKSFLES